MNMLRKVFGSVVCICVGIIAGLVVWLVFGLCVNLESLPVYKILSRLGGPLELTAAVALPIWALILLPVYVLLPRRSVLWRPVVCTMLGGVAGAVIAFLAMFLLGGLETVAGLWICLIIGIVVGAVTCWFGAATVDYFRRSSAK